MNWTMSLFALCSLTGLVMVVGSLFLLWKGRIILEKQGDNYSASEVELPLGFKIKTQFPVLVMFLFGAFLLAFPIHCCPPLEMVTLTGKVNWNKPVEVYVVVDSQTTDANQGINLRVPYVKDRRYLVKYKVTDGGLLPDENVLLNGPSEYKLQGFANGNLLAPTNGPACGPNRAVERTTLSADQVAEFK